MVNTGDTISVLERTIMKQVIIFTTSTCPTCRQEKAWLTQQGIPFEEYDLEDVEVQQELRALETKLQRRFSAVPITVVGGKVFEGFEPSTFAEALREEDE